MATNKVLISTGAVLIFADSSYSPGTNTTLGTLTDDIDVAGLTAGQAREGVKADLGASHAPSYSVDLTVEFATDAAGTIDLYWSESHSSTPAVGNMGNVTGADADWAGAVGETLAESLLHMKFIGSFQCAVQNTADGVQIGHVGTFSPVQRYGVLVYHNNTADALHSDSVECAVRFTPIIPDIQEAA
jgi:hypothetical protein